jgi:diaminopimelate decarboxylase
MLNKTVNAISRLIINRSKRIQSRQENPNLAAWGLSRQDDQLIIDGVTASSLIETFGSPLLVVNETRLVHDINTLKKAFSSAPAGSRIVYSYKTNSIPGILRVIHDHGIGAEVISPFELWLSQKLSVPADQIVYNGVSKTEESLRLAIHNGLLSINADSMDELRLLKQLSEEMNKTVSVGLRLGLHADSQFGLDLEKGEAAAAARFVFEHPNCFQLQVVQFHALANAQNSRWHRHYLKLALNFILRLYKLHGVTVPYLDVGGGFGVPTVRVMSRREFAFYRLWKTLPKRPNGDAYQPPAQYLSDLVTTIANFCNEHTMPMPKLIIEPGRILASRAEVALTRVNSIKTKSNGLKFALTDIGKHSIAYPCDYEYHEILVANKLREKPKQLYNIVGRVCTTADLVARNKCLPELDKNDILAVLDAGAYFSSYAANFAFQRPAIIKVSNGHAEILRQEETFEHLIAMDTYAEQETQNEQTTKHC